jgi:transcriptional regulator with XRE-family HTH domain
MEITADDIRALMKARGWNQKDLTRHLGLGEGTVSHWLAGRRTPTGIYKNLILRLMAETAMRRTDMPGANREEIHDMIRRIVAATNPEPPEDATPEQRAYANGKREADRRNLMAVIDAMWLHSTELGETPEKNETATPKETR